MILNGMRGLKLVHTTSEFKKKGIQLPDTNCIPKSSNKHMMGVMGMGQAD